MDDENSLQRRNQQRRPNEKYNQDHSLSHERVEGHFQSSREYAEDAERCRSHSGSVLDTSHNSDRPAPSPSCRTVDCRYLRSFLRCLFTLSVTQREEIRDRRTSSAKAVFHLVLVGRVYELDLRHIHRVDQSVEVVGRRRDAGASGDEPFDETSWRCVDRRTLHQLVNTTQRRETVEHTLSSIDVDPPSNLLNFRTARARETIPPNRIDCSSDQLLASLAYDLILHTKTTSASRPSELNW